jgi:hypothetical protein
MNNKTKIKKIKKKEKKKMNSCSIDGIAKGDVIHLNTQLYFLNEEKKPAFNMLYKK